MSACSTLRVFSRLVYAYLGIPKPEIAKQTVVFQHVGAKLLDFGLVFEMEVAFKEAFVQFDDLSQRQMLPRGLVQPTSSLDELSGEEGSV